MSSRKSHILLQKHTYARPLMYVWAISRRGAAHLLRARPGGLFCTAFVQPGLHRHIPALSCTAGTRQAMALNPKHLPLLPPCYAQASARAARVLGCVQILSHSHIPGHPCVSPPLPSSLTCVHPPARRWPHLAASHMLSEALWVPASLTQPILSETHTVSRPCSPVHLARCPGMRNSYQISPALEAGAS